ncbi:MAG TPA: hypothetical protein VNO51_12670 [Ilumatobacteraceae bacterium]|nr:hypothetical protein [Ilumatobacteraceae bacterium]
MGVVAVLVAVLFPAVTSAETPSGDVPGVLAVGDDVGYVSLQPGRLLDTRPGAGTVDGLFAGGGAVGPSSTLELTVVGRGGVPATGVGAVVLNITATQPTASGFVTVHPTGAALPNASNLNFVAGQTTPNLTIARVGDGGNVSLFNFAGDTHLIADVVGWFPGTASVTGAPATAVSVGGTFSCALLVEATIKCWGRNNVGMLGNGTLVASDTPVPVTGITTAVSITSGDAHSCALLANGTIQCWGVNFSAELGDGTVASPDSPTPIQVVGINNARSINVGPGGHHTCAALTDGRVKCWGWNEFGQLGDGTRITYRGIEPGAVGGIDNAVSVSAGYTHSCAVLANGTVKCWGDNRFGQLGDGGTVSWAPAPLSVVGITNAVAVSSGGYHSCALLADRTLRCWGQNGGGELGNGGVPATSSTPVVVPGIANVTSLGAGYANTCVVIGNATLRCWGIGWLGDGSQSISKVPVVVAGIANGASVVGGIGHTCAVLADRRIKCWGFNQFGQVGDGTHITRSTPVSVYGL